MRHLLRGNRTWGLTPFASIRFRFNGVLLRPLAGAGEDIREVLPAADESLRRDDPLLIDEEREGGGEDLVALREAESLLDEHGEAGARLRGPPARRFRVAI